MIFFQFICGHQRWLNSLDIKLKILPIALLCFTLNGKFTSPPWHKHEQNATASDYKNCATTTTTKENSYKGDFLYIHI